MRFLDSGCQGSLGHSLPQDTSLCVSWRETNIWSRELEKELFFDGLSHHLWKVKKKQDEKERYKVILLSML